MSDQQQRPAIDGGEPVFPQGPPSWPPPDEEVRAALAAAYADGSWGKYDGGHVARLTEALATLHGVEFVIPCCSGTFAVELALRALKIGAGDEVALAGYDFSGNFRAIESVGARPVLVDIEPQTWCLDVESFERALGPEVKAVIVSHLHGGLADMRALMSMCRERSIMVIEDACQSPGASVQGRMAGTWGDVGVLSFGGSKLLTAGRGGAILTSRPEIAQRAKIWCDRGNHAFPLSELQAAVLIPQVAKLSERNTVRQARARQLRESTAGLEAMTPVAEMSDRGTASYFKFAWLLNDKVQGGQSREDVICALQAEGIAIDAGFRGFTGRSAGRCRKSVELNHSADAAARTLVLHHPILLESPAVIEQLARGLRKASGRVTRDGFDGRAACFRQLSLVALPPDRLITSRSALTGTLGTCTAYRARRGNVATAAPPWAYRPM